jgi:hypothetical protein
VTTLRNATASFGMTIRVGTEALIVRELGRYFVEGNNAMHRIKIVDAAGPTDLGVVIVNMAGASVDPDDPYVYASLPSPFVTLNAGGEYHIVSEERDPGDQFADQNTSVQTTLDATVLSAVNSDAPGLYVAIPGKDHSYGPLNLRYVIDFS